MVVIICATEREANPIINALERKEVEWDKHPFTAVIGWLCGQQVLIMACNAGKVNAAAATVQAFFTVKPSVILNLGVCGALMAGYKQGDIVVPQEFVQHDLDTTAVGDPLFYISGLNCTTIPADCNGWKLISALRENGMKVKRPQLCATGDWFIEEGMNREMIGFLSGADICDMEAGAIAQVCKMYDIPFAAAKIVSDGKGDTAKDYEAFMEKVPGKLIMLARSCVKAYTDRGDF